MRGLGRVARAGARWVFAPEWLDELRAELRAGSPSPTRSTPASPPPTEPWAAAVLPLLPLERRGAKLYAPGATALARARRRPTLVGELERAGSSRAVDDRQLAAYLESEGRLVRVGDGLAFAAPPTRRPARRSWRSASAGPITLARFRDLLGLAPAPQLLLERFDADGLTRRIGDERVLRRRARP